MDYVRSQLLGIELNDEISLILYKFCLLLATANTDIFNEVQCIQKHAKGGYQGFQETPLGFHQILRNLCNK